MTLPPLPRTLPWLPVCLTFAGLAALGCGSGGGSSENHGEGASSGSSGSSGSTGSSGGTSGSSGGGASGSSGGGAGSSGASSSGGDPPSDASHGDAGPFAALRFSEIGTPTKVGSQQFYFTEGPVWDPASGVLYFTDINTPGSGGSAVGGGTVYRLTPPSTIDTFLAPSGNADGLGLDAQGNLIAAGFLSRDVWRRSSAGAMQVLSPCASSGGSCYSGTEINTPDDVAARSDGIIYFTDPTFASGSQGFPTLTLPLQSAQGVYRLTTDGVLHLEDSTTSGPNGVNLSPDEKTLYVSYTLAGSVSKFDVAADGSLSHKTTFATGATVADSMCVDAGGNVYVGTYSGLAVFDPTGKNLGTVSVAGLVVTNCAFGGADQKTLYITARTAATLSGAPPLGGGLLYEITSMPVPGMPGRN